MYKICILAKVWWGKSGAESDSKLVLTLVLRDSHAVPPLLEAFSLDFQMAPVSGSLVNLKCALLKLTSSWWAFLSALIFCPQKVFSQNLRLASRVLKSHHQHRVTRASQLGYSYCLSIGSVALHLQLTCNKKEKQFKINTAFSFHTNSNSGVEKLSKMLLVAFI